MQMPGHFVIALACWTISGINCEKLEESLEEPTRLLAQLLLTSSPARTPTSFSVPKGAFPKKQMFKRSKKYIPVTFDVDDEQEAQDMSAMYAELESAFEKRAFPSFKVGDIASGTIEAFTESGGAMLDMGMKEYGMLDKDDISLDRRAPTKASDLFEIGQKIDVMVKRSFGTGVDLSLRAILRDAAWKKMKANAEEGTVFDVEVVSVNKGGLLGSAEGLTAFMPGSHISNGPADESWVGKILPCKVLDIDAESQKLLFSNRLAVKESMKDVIASLKPGMLIEGIVTGIKPYGLFVTLKDGPSGLLHISQISKARVSIEALPLAPGDPIKALVNNIDAAAGRLQLNTALLEKEPGDMLKDPQGVFSTAEASAAELAENRAKEIERAEKANEELMSLFEEGSFDGTTL